MPRDYAKNNQPPRRAAPRSRVPRWVWLFTSSVVVLFAGGLFLLSQMPEDGSLERTEWPSLSALVPDSPYGEEPPVPEEPTAEPEPDDDPSLSRRAQLEFYTLLQQTDVFIPDEVVALRQRDIIDDPEDDSTDPPTAPTDEEADTAPEASAGQFVIQVASFSSASDADNLRANLILEGLTSAHVTAADLGEQGVFHRVMIGPVNSAQETESIGGRLEDMGLQGLVRTHSPD